MDEPDRRVALLERERRRQLYVRRGQERRQHTNINTRFGAYRRTANSQEALYVEKRDIILQNLIHKKVLSKSTSILKHRSQHLVLPHEKQLSLRQSYSNNHLSCKISSSYSITSGIDDRTHERKSHILIETLRSIRSALNISIHSDYEENETFYSPKTCPICCEDYVKGDDIAWSKNEECCHAFHTDCILPWLMEHDGCPMCRSDYINIKEMD